MVCPLSNAIYVPESDIGTHFGELLENEEGSDIIFNVSGEQFFAHKIVLAARSPIFQSDFFTEFGDPVETPSEITITDIDPKVFKVQLPSSFHIFAA